MNATPTSIQTQKVLFLDFNLLEMNEKKEDLQQLATPILRAIDQMTRTAIFTSSIGVDLTGYYCC